MAEGKRIAWVEKDFGGAELGDARRSARLLQVVDAVARQPGLGFPRAFESTAELEGFYRFINNDAFDGQAVLKPHRKATQARAEASDGVLFIHDTTTVEFRGEGTREGLGYTTALGRQGFMAHVSLCISASSGLPLGISNIETYTRTGKTWRKRKKKRSARRDGEPRESARWLRGVTASETEALRGRAIHIMDAEADFFDLMRQLTSESSRFVIRAGQLERLVHDEGELVHLRQAVDGLKAVAHRDVFLSERKRNVKTQGAKGRKKHPPRDARTARVAIAGTTVSFGKTRYTRHAGGSFELNVVRAWEVSPPPGEDPVDWILLTSEPVGTQAQLKRIADLYCKRWTIEDYFKALKTGCSLERRQVESYDALRKVLAILAPIACRLLWLRAMDRTNSNAPAASAFDAVSLELLQRDRATRGMRPPRTVGDAVALLARLGGHIKNNGPPGWMTLGRGYEKLLLLKAGWHMAFDSIQKK